MYWLNQSEAPPQVVGAIEAALRGTDAPFMDHQQEGEAA